MGCPFDRYGVKFLLKAPDFIIQDFIKDGSRESFYLPVPFYLVNAESLSDAFFNNILYACFYLMVYLHDDSLTFVPSFLSDDASFHRFGGCLALEESLDDDAMVD
ncbi:hypothetical protein Tco_1505526 [Tanacetum coccineum]